MRARWDFFLIASSSSPMSLFERASVELACRGQFGLPSGPGPIRPRPRGVLALQRLPSLNQSQPECPVTRAARSSGKATAFIGAPPKLLYTHVTALGRPAQAPYAGRETRELYRIFGRFLIKIFARTEPPCRRSADRLAEKSAHPYSGAASRPERMRLDAIASCSHLIDSGT